MAVGAPSWSPHGSLIAFEQVDLGSRYGPPYELRVIPPDGRGVRVVAWLEDGAFAPLRWAPDSPA